MQIAHKVEYLALIKKSKRELADEDKSGIRCFCPEFLTCSEQEINSISQTTHTYFLNTSLWYALLIGSHWRWDSFPHVIIDFLKNKEKIRKKIYYIYIFPLILRGKQDKKNPGEFWISRQGWLKNGTDEARYKPSRCSFLAIQGEKFKILPEGGGKILTAEVRQYLARRVERRGKIW